MTDTYKAARDIMVAKFEAHVAQLFAADPARQSAILAVAQYWNDSADDEVHGHVIVSTRATPVWPHECDYHAGDETNDYADETRPLLAGEACDECVDTTIYLSFYGGYGDETVGAFEPFCMEGAHQGMTRNEAYVPFAVARRTVDGLDLEIIGHPQRPPVSTIGSARAYDWPDARARALFDEVCRSVVDDAPRIVLSDYLLEAHPGDPRGEAIALALARDLDAESRTRRAALFAEHADRWLFPIGDVIVPACAHFERGFLARADVYAERIDDRVLDAPAWGTVETITLAPGSRDVVSPAMLALRSIGPLRDEGCRMLARAPMPWRLEHVRVEDGDHAALFGAPLPHLRHLELPASRRERIDSFRRARWWPQLERLVFHDIDDAPALADWFALRGRLDVRELGFITKGWQLGFRADDVVTVRWGAWSGAATLEQLAELVAPLRQSVMLELVSTRARVFEATDVAWLHERTDRDIRTSGRV